MSDWIDCNLPWSSNPLSPYPDVSDEIREHFGTSKAEVFDKWFPQPGLDELLEIEGEIDPHRDLSEEEKEKTIVRAWSLRGDEQKKRAEAWLLWRQILQWEDENLQVPEEKEEQPSFEGLGLNKPGTRIQLESGQVLWIGDINPNRGVCDDCCLFDEDTLVVRYKPPPED